MTHAGCMELSDGAHGYLRDPCSCCSPTALDWSDGHAGLLQNKGHAWKILSWPIAQCILLDMSSQDRADMQEQRAGNLCAFGTSSNLSPVRAENLFCCQLGLVTPGSVAVSSHHRVCWHQQNRLSLWTHHLHSRVRGTGRPATES